MKILNFIKFTTRIFSAFLLFLIVGTTFFQVIMRYLFNISYVWVEELAIWSMVWLVFLGSVLGVIEMAHPRIDFLVNRLPGKIKITVEIFTNLVCAIVVAILTYYTLPLIKLNSNNISVGLQLPVSILYYSLLIGGALMTLFFVVTIYEKGKMLREGA
ncbi:TRAP transporter small permease [Oceanobacillus saliphilus]|uniref:TRAP transporter small permease n=1 Tax=Oceanobacillus saliphilus TaxID=2925834 RepID=UPI00201D37AE|nr:TRAP transporter small permease [Oceanobacillus saliphilus]